MKYSIIHIKRYSIIGIVIISIIGMLFITIPRLLSESPGDTNALISQQINRLKLIFNTINDTCSITNFKNDKTIINFLNVKSFDGSEVGGMYLAHPGQWNGPYLPQNLEIQNIFYQIIKTNKGYLIAPGDGVKFNDGKTLGKDIFLTSSSDIDALLQGEKSLSSQGKALVALIGKSEDIAQSKNNRASSAVSFFTEAALHADYED